MTKHGIMREVNKYLAELGKEYHYSIPLIDIFEELDRYNLSAVDEDGEPWQGMLLGADSRTTIEVIDMETGKYFCTLYLSWYKMESGRYEIVSYIS